MNIEKLQQYKNPWHCIAMEYAFSRELSREEILEIVNEFNKYCTYK